jgi:hypothetical protein
MIQKKILKNQCVIIQGAGPDYRYVNLWEIFLSGVFGGMHDFYFSRDRRTRSRASCVDSILSCLVQISLDPYFRGIEGFMQLLRKDWFLEGYVLSTSYSSFSLVGFHFADAQRAALGEPLRLHEERGEQPFPWPLLQPEPLSHVHQLKQKRGIVSVSSRFYFFDSGSFDIFL